MTSALSSFCPHVCPACLTPTSASASACSACYEMRPRGGWPVDPNVGRLFGGRYRVHSAIASGGTGQLYRASDNGSSLDLGDVALKILKNPTHADERRRFSTEAHAARALKSHHVVRIYDFGFDSGNPFIVMEHLEGETVQKRLRDGAFSVELSISIALQVASALDEAHRAGIIHRDIKPSNIMLLGPDYTFAKLLDFGAARVSSGDATCTAIGTPRYMPPEQILGQPIDGRADVYALGACLYEMLLGKPPFEFDADGALFRAHIEALPTRLCKMRDDIPEWLSNLVAEMLAKSATHRPESMAAVRHRLESAAEVPVAGSQGRKRVPAVLNVALAALVLAAIGFMSPHAFTAHTAQAAEPFSPIVRAAATMASNSIPARRIEPRAEDTRPPSTNEVAPGTIVAQVGVRSSERPPPRRASVAPEPPAASAHKVPRSGELKEDEF